MAKFKPQPNILDNYNLSTYNLTFYMLPPELIASGNRKVDWDPGNGIIIAQSGVTSQIFIDDFSVTSFPGFGKHTKNSTNTKYSLSLQEFSGASLIDKLIAASFELRADSYFQIPYFIQLSFKANRGPGENGSPNGTMPLPIVPDFNYRWPLMITGVETSVDGGGATYSITGYHYDEMVQQLTFGLVDKAWQITAATVGAALTQLASELTKRQKEREKTDQVLGDQYVLNVHPKIAKYKLNSDSLEELNRNASMKDSEINATNLSSVKSEKNVSVTDLINRIVTASPDYQKAAQDTKTPTENNAQDKPDGNIKELHRVITRSDQMEYDIGRGVYQHKFTYFIRPYLIGSLITSPDDANIDTKDRFQKYLENGLLNKRYDYIFTGKNDQVLEFDLNFNYSWYANMPTQGGIKTDYAHMAEGRKFSEDMQRLKDSNIAAAQELRKLSAAKTKGRTAEEIKQIEISVQAAISNIVTTESEQEIIDRLTSIARTNRIAFVDREPEEKTRFLEDISVLDLTNNARFRKYPLAFMETSYPQFIFQDLTKTIDIPKTGGAQYVNSLFNQAFSAQSADLIEVQMKIKGDPYWLGKTVAELPTIQTNVTNVTPSQLDRPAPANDALSAALDATVQAASDAFTFIPSDGSTPPTQAVTPPLRRVQEDELPALIEPTASFGGSPAILFTLNTPELPGVDTGTVRSRSTALNGVYLIRQIEHEFSNGLFTQTLYGTIDPTIDIDRVMKDL